MHKVNIDGFKYKVVEDRGYNMALKRRQVTVAVGDKVVLAYMNEQGFWKFNKSKP